MARNYSTRELFRKTPNALLARCFQKRRLLGDLDFTTLKEPEPDVLIDALLLLPDEVRRPMDAEFQDIFALSCEDGFLAILDEADWHLFKNPGARAELVEYLSARPSHFDRAMVAFLD